MVRGGMGAAVRGSRRGGARSYIAMGGGAARWRSSSVAAWIGAMGGGARAAGAAAKGAGSAVGKRDAMEGERARVRGSAERLCVWRR